jgi:hypothetical protein
VVSLQRKEIFIESHSVKCCNSVRNVQTQAFNARASRLAIVSCTVRSSSETIYVAAMEALRKNERQDETQFTTKSGKMKDSMKLSLPPKVEK